MSPAVGIPRRRPPPPAAAARLPARPTRPSRPPVRPLARPTAHPPPPPPENFCACRIYFWRIYCCCERTAATGHRRSPGTTGPAHHKNHGDRMTTPLSPTPPSPCRRTSLFHCTTNLFFWTRHHARFRRASGDRERGQAGGRMHREIRVGTQGAAPWREIGDGTTGRSQGRRADLEADHFCRSFFYFLDRREHHPAPRTPHPTPGILCLAHAPRTPHPTPSTLYHIGLRRPRTPDTQRRGSVAKALQRRGARHGNFQAPPPFFFPPPQDLGSRLRFIL